jgi:hypothetical protein
MATTVASVLLSLKGLLPQALQHLNFSRCLICLLAKASRCCCICACGVDPAASAFLHGAPSPACSVRLRLRIYTNARAKNQEPLPCQPSQPFRDAAAVDSPALWYISLLLLLGHLSTLLVSGCFCKKLCSSHADHSMHQLLEPFALPGCMSKNVQASATLYCMSVLCVKILQAPPGCILRHSACRRACSSPEH